MPFLVRANRHACQSRSGSQPRVQTEGHRTPYERLPEMGGYDTVDYTGHAECHSPGASIHLPVEDDQSGSQGTERKRVSAVDGSADVGK